MISLSASLIMLRGNAYWRGELFCSLVALQDSETISTFETRRARFMFWLRGGEFGSEVEFGFSLLFIEELFSIAPVTRTVWPTWLLRSCELMSSIVWPCLPDCSPEPLEAFDWGFDWPLEGLDWPDCVPDWLDCEPAVGALLSEPIWLECVPRSLVIRKYLLLRSAMQPVTVLCELVAPERVDSVDWELLSGVCAGRLVLSGAWAKAVAEHANRTAPIKVRFFIQVLSI
jgi:hypothetical protein